MQPPNKNGDIFPDYSSVELKIIKGRLKTGIPAVDIVFGGGVPIKNPCSEISLDVHDECAMYPPREYSILDDVVALRMIDEQYQALDKFGQLIALVTYDTAQVLVKRGVELEPSSRKQLFKMMNFAVAYGWK